VVASAVSGSKRGHGLGRVERGTVGPPAEPVAVVRRSVLELALGPRRTGDYFRQVGTRSTAGPRSQKNASLTDSPARPACLATDFRSDVGRDAVARALHRACALSFRRRTKPGARHVGTTSGSPVSMSTIVLAAWPTRNVASLDTYADRGFVTSAF